VSIKEGIIQTVAPTNRPVSVQEVKNYLRIDASEDDTHVELLIDQAAEHVTRCTGLALTTATYRATYATWPQSPKSRCDWSGERERINCGLSRTLELPIAPVVAVSSVQYYADDAEARSTLDSARYVVCTDNQPGIIYLKDAYDWPDLEQRPDAVSVTFTAGFGTDPASMPPRLKMAVLLLCRYYYAGGSPSGSKDQELDLERGEQILSQFKINGWTA